MTGLQFFDVRSRRKFASNKFDIREKSGRFFAVARSLSGENECWKVLSKDFASIIVNMPVINNEIVTVCKTITKETAKYLVKHNTELYEIPSDYFEKLIAEILASFGFEIQLNVRLFDHHIGDEADIIAIQKIKGLTKPVGYIVECKKYKPERKVNLQIATHLFGLKQNYAKSWGLDHALLATTSTVTKDVYEVYGKRWDFEIKDHDQIVDWLKIYSTNYNSPTLYGQKFDKNAKELFLTSCEILRIK
ncbi:MAG: restriction endonuclease [Candidatus Aminicenantes bacterium]|nr:restriction endonuclease [Candidatus Aminicenantes bacterium]